MSAITGMMMKTAPYPSSGFKLDDQMMSGIRDQGSGIRDQEARERQKKRGKEETGNGVMSKDRG
jgi:hypothetical protein